MRIIAEMVGEILIKVVGYVLVMHGWYLGQKSPDPDGAACVFAGLLFWVLMIDAGVYFYRHAHAGAPA